MSLIFGNSLKAIPSRVSRGELRDRTNPTKLKSGRSGARARSSRSTSSGDTTFDATSGSAGPQLCGSRFQCVGFRVPASALT